MIERFLKQTTFTSQEDYKQNLQFVIPDNFNYAYDVIDEWAKTHPEKLAILWSNDEDVTERVTFAQLKEKTDRAASYFTQLGIGKGDPVMLVLKRRIEFWISILALHKIGAIAIPATHMLTTHDIVYRNTQADIKAIICVGETYVQEQIFNAMADSPSLQVVISVGP